MNYKPIIDKLHDWKNYNGSGDAYRKAHDLDCILTGGNLLADTIFSLWLPLRYTLTFFESPRWSYWKAYEANFLSKNKISLKNHHEFIEELERNMESFLPAHDLTCKLTKLFELGQKRCNVMLLPNRRWNAIRGGRPYFDYLPHFLYDLLDTEDLLYKNKIVTWMKKEHLTVFFEKGIIDKEHILDLAGTGCVYRHSPTKIVLSSLLQNYINLLEERERLMSSAAYYQGRRSYESPTGASKTAAILKIAFC